MPRKNKASDIFKWVDMRNGNEKECWPWKGKLNKSDQRPYFTIEGKRRPAYAIALEAFSGILQVPGMVARHKCDNSICCNPHHLEWGTHQDNMNDMKERERHGLPKTVVRAILKLRNDGRTQQQVADLYGISRETVSSIDTNRNNRSTPKDTERAKQIKAIEE